VQKNDNTDGVSSGSSNESDEGENTRDEELEIEQVVCIVFFFSHMLKGFGIKCSNSLQQK
jgi:hypothetical protein